MIKQELSLATAGFVLIAGLVSCAKDKKVTKDVYKPPAPKIVQTARAAGLNEGQVDLQDILDVSAGSPTTVVVDGSCVQGGVNTPIQRRFDGETHIPFYRIVPEKFLYEKLESAPPVCTFVVTLKNAQGSGHMFDPVSRILQDLIPPPVQTGLDNGAPLPPYLDRDQMKGVRIRYSSPANATAAVICENISIPPLDFKDVLDMELFDFSKWTKRSDVAAKPVENCRIQITNNNRVSAIGSLFKLIVPFQAFVIEEAEQSTPPAQAGKLITDAQIQGGQPPFAIGQVTIRNPEESARYIRLPRQLFPLSLSLFNLEPRLFPQVTFQAQLELIPKTGFDLVMEDGQSRLLRIPGQGQIQIEVSAQVARFTENIKIPWDDQIARSAQPIPFEETDEHGVPIGQKTLTLQECFIGTQRAMPTGTELSALKAQIWPGCK